MDRHVFQEGDDKGLISNHDYGQSDLGGIENHRESDGLAAWLLKEKGASVDTDLLAAACS